MTSIQNKTVAIVGGGPGGLTLARLLQMNGVHVAVYERDSGQASRNQGATLDLHHDSGLKALESAGLMRAFRENYRVGADRMVLMDQNGKIFLDDFGSGELGPERPEIDRGPLRDLLIGSLQPATVIWDRQFTSLERNLGQIVLRFANGETATADVVIAADGVNSRVRPYISRTAAIYSGVSIVEGSVSNAAIATPELHKLLGEGKICALGDRKSLFIGAKGDGSLAFYTGHKTQEKWAHESGIDCANIMAMRDWFKHEFAGWSTLWNPLFEQADPKFVIRPQYYFPLDQTWEPLPDLTMIGDAAHVMPPYAGEGVNMAMLDALELAECFLSDDFNDTQSAIGSFEEKMRKRASATTEMTLAFTEAFHAENAISELMTTFQNHISQ